MTLVYKEGDLIRRKEKYRDGNWERCCSNAGVPEDFVFRADLSYGDIRAFNTTWEPSYFEPAPLNKKIEDYL